MTEGIFLNMILNIGLLVLAAGMLTKLPPVRSLLLDEDNPPLGKCALAVIFGLVSILSTYTGTSVEGAIVNTRVIGVLAAGLLGGPSVGIGAALIAGTHRYLFDIGGFTAFSCAVSTFAEGMLGALFSRYFRRGEWDNAGIFILTAVTEMIQMLIILCLARPFSQALALVRIIAVPMILLNSIGMVAFIGTFKVVFVEDDNIAAGRIGLAFRIMEQSLPHLRKGLQSRPDMEAAAEIIFRSLPCRCVMITDRREVLALAANDKDRERFSTAELPALAREAMERKEVLSQTLDKKSRPLYPPLNDHLLVAAPLIELEQAAGCLAVIVKKQWHPSSATETFLRELSRLFSTQLELSDLDYQRRQRKKAEYRALRTQINPHFLYNALNTIASVCRDDPDRSRVLLRTLATYYRQTLESSRSMVSLATELYQVMNYLELEKARFEEKLEVELDVPEELHCMVPSFILQPLVENAIRHGADSRGFRYVRIQAREQEDGAEISVSDHGKGFPPEILEQLYDETPPEQGKRIGLLNVHQRLKSIYGEGLRISSSGQGSSVSFLISPSPAAELLAEEDREAAQRNETNTSNHKEGQP